MDNLASGKRHGAFLLLSALALLTQGCELTTYRPLGFHGGYSSSHIGGSTYRVYALGTYTSDYETIKEYFHRRASELCQGHGTKSYEVLGLSERPCTFCLTVKPEIVGTIQCIGPEGLAIAGRGLVFGSQLDRDFSLLANQLMHALSKKSFRLAVFPFHSTRDKKSGQLGLYCSDKLTAALFSFKNVQMVERMQLDTAVEELELTHSGRFDEGTIKSIGQFLGVDAIVVGSYTVPERVGADINARVIEVATGKVLGVGSVRIPRVWIEGLLSS